MYKTSTLAYPDPQGYYCIGPNGQINWVSVPFPACCIESIGRLKEQQLVNVEQVGFSKLNEVVFIIGNSGYLHHYFVVPIYE